MLAEKAPSEHRKAQQKQKDPYKFVCTAATGGLHLRVADPRAWKANRLARARRSNRNVSAAHANRYARAFFTKVDRDTREDPDCAANAEEAHLQTLHQLRPDNIHSHRPSLAWADPVMPSAGLESAGTQMFRVPRQLG